MIEGVGPLENIYETLEQLNKISTKHCPKCGNEDLGLMRTHKLKYCVDCYTWIPWELDPGQKAVGY